MNGLIDDILHCLFDIVEFILIPLGILFCVFVIFVCSLIYLTAETKTQTEYTYKAWCKLTNREDISIEEWKVLRKNYLLPGMEVKRVLEQNDGMD